MWWRGEGEWWRGEGVVERGGKGRETQWEGGVPPLFHDVDETRKIPDTVDLSRFRTFEGVQGKLKIPAVQNKDSLTRSS